MQILFLLFPFLFQLAYSQEQASVPPEPILKGSVSSRVIYNSDFRQDVDTGNTHIEASNYNLHDVIENFNSADYRVENIWEFSIKVSGTPYLMGSSVRTQLDDALNQKIAEVSAQGAKQIQAALTSTDQMIQGLRAQSLSQVPALTQQSILAYGPSYASLPPDVQTMLQQQFAQASTSKINATYDLALAQANEEIALAAQQASAQIAAVRRQRLAEIKKRLDQIELETAVQEVAIRYAHLFRHGIVYLQVGKMEIDAAGPTDSQGRTYIERILPGNENVQRLNGVAATGTTNVGLATDIRPSNDPKGPLVFQTDAFFVHNRPPWDSAGDYVSEVESLLTKEFNENKRFWELDTAILRFMIKTNRFSAYVTGATGESSNWFGGGFDVNFLKKYHFIVDATHGNRFNAKDGVSAYVTREITPSFTVYVGTRYLQDRFFAPVSIDGGFDQINGLTGVSYQSQNPLLFGLNPRLNLQAYYANRYHFTDGDHFRSGPGLQVSIDTEIGADTARETQRKLWKQMVQIDSELDKVDLESPRGRELLAEKSSLNQKLGESIRKNHLLFPIKR